MNQPTLLVVEDNPTLQKMVSLMAKRRGVPTLVVGTCAEAIQAIESGTEFGLVLMDWSLPDKSGLECTGCLRNLMHTNIPIVAMTGHAMPGDRETCLNSGMDDYLCKPFSYDQFSKLISRWMRIGSVAPTEFPISAEECSQSQILPPPVN